MTNGYSSDRIPFDSLGQYRTGSALALQGHILAILPICTQAKVWSEVESYTYNTFRLL